SRSRAPETTRYRARNGARGRTRAREARASDVRARSSQPTRQEVLERQDALAPSLVLEVAHARLQDIVQRELADQLARIGGGDHEQARDAELRHAFDRHAQRLVAVDRLGIAIDDIGERDVLAEVAQLGTRGRADEVTAVS